MFVDEAIITVSSGKGGSGCVAFRREKHVAKGGPSGGDGGNGGDVVFRADLNVDTLHQLTGKHHWTAKKGRPGEPKQAHGANGEDCIIRVAPGTLIYNHSSGELLCDLDEDGKEVIIAKGGRGGFGNEHFKSPINQTPRTCTPGEPAVEITLRLELKLIADVGLIGKPNAGKSTLLSVLSRARPKIADYPFTTLEPNLGIAFLPGDVHRLRQLVLADIPGLIQGASKGQGLGHEFLRHIERTRMLVHLVEVEPTDESDPIVNYKVICEELAGYSEELANKPQVVVLSKLDLLPDPDDQKELIAKLEKASGGRVLALSSATRQGMDPLLNTCWDQINKLNTAE